MYTPADYRELAPLPRLGLHVECLWSHGRTAVRQRVLPDTCVDLVFSQETGLQVVGSMTRAMPVEPAGAGYIGVRLRPGVARSMLQLPIEDLRDEVLSLPDLWGSRGRDMEERLRNAQSAQEAMEMLQSILVSTDPLSAIQSAIGELAANGGCVRLDDIARHTGLGIRQFRRRCMEETGLSPKHLARIGRFRRALFSLFRRVRVNWADLASEFGYYDQAHLINDFQEFSGTTPHAYWRQLRQ